MISTAVIRFAGDPSSLGLAAAVGERLLNTLTGAIWVKSGTGDTDPRPGRNDAGISAGVFFRSS